MTTSKEPFIGKTVVITAKIEEHLVLGKQEWFTIRLENNQVLTIKKPLCTILVEETNE